MDLPPGEELVPLRVSIHVAPKDILDGIGRFDGKAVQSEARFFQCAAALAVVAGSAGGDDIIPDVFAPQVARNDVVDGQVQGVFAAILAGEVIATEDFTAGQLQSWPGTVHHVLQADNGRYRQGHINRS